MMAKKLPCLSRMGLCHDGQEDCVSVKNRKNKILATEINNHYFVVKHGSRFCRGWDYVTMAKKIACLSRMGLCYDGQEAPVSVEDGTFSR